MIKKETSFIDLKQVKIDDPFFSRVQNVVIHTMLPYQERVLHDEVSGIRKSHVIKNFRIAAGDEKGTYYGRVFQDSDLAKWLEAVAYSLTVEANPELEARADVIIDLIGRAQQPDGYLDTYFIAAEPEHKWQNLTDCHEMYCAGHMTEAGVAYYQATGKTKLLDICCKLCDHIDRRFGREAGKVTGIPGHEEIELALVKIYRTTGQEKYLDFANWLLEERGHGHGSMGGEGKWDPAYYQDVIPVRELTDISGHAVRCMYLYCGMADVAALKKDTAYVEALNRLWDDVVLRNMYVTGGIGSSRHNEGFTEDYDLPNLDAYCETCASVGMVYWNQRMNQFTGDSKYIDVLERSMYNGALAGVSLAGDRFFYVNPLESNGDHHRQAWYGCACCPSQISRFLPSIGNYIYGTSDKALWVNLFIGNTTEVTIDGKKVVMKQETDYPWDGLVKLTVTSEQPLGKELRIRIPGWCKSYTLSVNGNKVDSTTDKGYTVIKEWKTGDLIVLNMDMPVEKVSADPRVRQNTGKRALQRGPLVYCLEETDNAKDFADLALTPTSSFEVKDEPDNLGGIRSIKAISNGQTLHFIPYYAWDNRKAGKMKVWIDYQE